MKRHPDRFLAVLILLSALSGGVAAQFQVDDSTADSNRTGVISGRVVTENGQPLASVRVSLYSWHNPAQSSTTTTDSEGRFQVTGLDPALYLVMASAPSYIPPSLELGSQPSYYRIGDSVTVTLIKGGVITGTVTAASGDPLVQIGVRALLIRDVNGQKYAVNLPERITDDRGVYRLYGLPPGTYLIAAGGRGSFSENAYDTDAPTYAPTSTRDTAVEINVRAGEERSGVDIRYRAEPGHVVSGTVNGPSATSGNYAGVKVTLTQISNGTRQSGFGPARVPGNRDFSFYGIGDGDYELTAVIALGPNELALSEPRRITVKGADLTGLELITKPLGSVSGHLVLENSTSPECKVKQKPLFAEILLLVQNNSKEPARDDLQSLWFAQPVTPDKAGKVLFSNLGPGQYRFDALFRAKYWYLKTIVQPAATAPTVLAQSAPAYRPVDAARNWIGLKQGERLSGLTFTLAEGAASLRGSIKPAEGERIPAQLYLHLVPSERDKAEDVLRYFATPVNADGTFALGNLPPGRYWALVRVAGDNEPHSDSKLRATEEAETRVQIRRAAEAARISIEFKPCQNISDYQLPFKISSVKN